MVKERFPLHQASPSLDILCWAGMVFAFPFVLLVAFLFTLPILLAVVLSCVAIGLSFYCYRIKGESQRELYLSKVGLGYKDKNYHLLIPWYNLDPHKPVWQGEDGRVYINVISDQKGIGYRVYRAKHQVDDESEESPFVIEGKQGVLSIEMGDEILKLIDRVVAFRDQYGKPLDEHAQPDKQKPLLHHSWIDQNSQSVSIPNDLQVRYPPFCPLTGEDCDQMREVNEEKWLISSTWNKRQMLFYWMRMVAHLISFACFVSYGYVTCFVWRSSFDSDWMVLLHLLIGLSFFSIAGVVEVLTLPQMIIDRNKSSSFTVVFRDPEYFDAFVDINGVQFHSSI